MTVNMQTTITSFIVTGLLAFTTYTFSVAGSKTMGMGRFSATAAFRTAEDSKLCINTCDLILSPQSLYSNVEVFLYFFLYHMNC